MNKFYINTDNKISGPYTAKQILEMNLRNDTLVKEESINEWVPVSKFDWDVAEQKLIQKLPESSDLKNKVSNTYPLIITDIEIANVTYDGDIITNYGNSIYESTTMYLQPRIKYTGLCSGTKTIKVKWYNPDGTIHRGTSSPPGFSQSQSMYVYSGDNNTYTLSGWGNSSKGHWRSGTYRIEIWYENTCLKSKTFTIY